MAKEEEHDGEEELTPEEIAVAAYNKVDALLELLIRKGVVTEAEIDEIESEYIYEDGEGDEEDEE